MKPTLKFLSLFTLVLFAIAACGGPSASKGQVYSASGQSLELCEPDGPVRKTGLIFIHGGGFSSGDRSQMLGYCKLLAQGGFTSATISYRLTSQGHAYPAALEDVKSAVKWMRGNAGSLGIDSGKIVLIGYSAGATLALSAGLSDTNIAGIVSVAGISDFAVARAETPHAQLRRDIDAYIKSTPARQASPISIVDRHDPPVFLFHGESDTLVPLGQSVSMARALKTAGVTVLFKTFKGAGHEIMLPNKHLKTLLGDMTRFLVAIDES
ncbi:MAG: alpha/beta hydrolase [Litoreibacter sp.]